MGLSENGCEYSFGAYIKSYETDMFQELTASAALKFFQEISGNHLSCFDMSYNQLKDDGVVFLLTSLVMRINHPPLLHPPVTVTTWHLSLIHI